MRETTNETTYSFDAQYLIHRDAVTVPQDGVSARELLPTVARALTGWQATAFPSHMILYKEHRTYTHGEAIWPD